jgi:hypothetical protein
MKKRLISILIATAMTVTVMTVVTASGTQATTIARASYRAEIIVNEAGNGGYIRYITNRPIVNAAEIPLDFSIYEQGAVLSAPMPPHERSGLPYPPAARKQPVRRCV